MWATLHTFEHNNLDGMTLIPAPKYGQTLRSWARKHRSAITLLKNVARNALGYIFEPDEMHGLRMQPERFHLEKNGAGGEISKRSRASD
jgi:hypothetical protein